MDLSYIVFQTFAKILLISTLYLQGCILEFIYFGAFVTKIAAYTEMNLRQRLILTSKPKLTCLLKLNASSCSSVPYRGGKMSE